MFENKVIELMVQEGHKIVGKMSVSDIKEKYPRYYRFAQLLEGKLGTHTIMPEAEVEQPYIITDAIVSLMDEFEKCTTLVESDIVVEKLFYFTREAFIVVMKSQGIDSRSIESFREEFSQHTETSLRPIFNEVSVQWISELN